MAPPRRRRGEGRAGTCSLCEGETLLTHYRVDGDTVMEFCDDCADFDRDRWVEEIQYSAFTAECGVLDAHNPEINPPKGETSK